jgi:hypothetical protein
MKKISVIKKILACVACILIVSTGAIGFTCIGKEKSPYSVQPEGGMVGITMDYEDSPFGFIQGEYGENDDGELYIVDLGVHWDKMFQPSAKLKINPDGSIDFTGQDEVVRWLVIEQGLNIPLSLPVFIEGEQLTHDAYMDLCNTLIEHYDGDGIDDADGSPVIKYWNVGFTEMNRGIAQGADISERPWKLDESATAEYVKIAYDCIKNMHSEFRVILGGSAGIMTWQQGGLDEYYYNLVSELTGDRRCPDIIFDYHQGSNPARFKAQIEAMNIVKETLINFGYANNDIWTTDVGGSWDDFHQGWTEKEHAGDVVRRYAYTIANGQKKLFWTRIVEYDWTDDDSSIFDYIGLVNNPLNTDGKDWKKLAYYTYKLMVEKLEGSDWDSITTIIDSIDNKYAYKFINESTGEPTYVAWWDYFNDPEYVPEDLIEFELYVGDIDSVIITQAVPDAESGADLDPDDYPDFFLTETKPVIDGIVTVVLGESPVFVEEMMSPVDVIINKPKNKTCH